MVYFVSFILVIYSPLLGRATGNDKGIAPWTSMVQHPSKYFDTDQVPEGFTLLDPSKMKDPQIQELLNYWHSRQEGGEKGVGFEFQGDERVNRRKPVRQTTPLSPDPSQQQRSKTGKGKERATELWVDPIMPDSCRRKRRRSLSAESSGEEFDFGSVERMEESDFDDAGHCPGPSSSHRLKDQDPPARNGIRFQVENKGSGRLRWSCLLFVYSYPPTISWNIHCPSEHLGPAEQAERP